MKKMTMHNLFIFIGVLFVVWFLYSWIPVINIEKPKYKVVQKTDDYEIRAYDSYIIAETVIVGAKDKNEAVNKGFSIIAGYIFGDNTKKGKIDMTAPVNTKEDVSEQIEMTAPVNTEKIPMTAPVNTEEVVSEKINMTVPVNTEEIFSENIPMTAPVNTGLGEGERVYKISFVMPSSYTIETLPKPNDSRVEIKGVPARKLAVRQFSWSNSESAFNKNEALLLESLKRDEVETVGQVNIARYNMPWTIPFLLRNEIQIEVR